jgi:hypothetical protein
MSSPSREGILIPLTRGRERRVGFIVGRYKHSEHATCDKARKIALLDVPAEKGDAPLRQGGRDAASIDLYVTARGGLLVGGDNGFYATLEATLDTATRSGTFSIVHEGGWSPFAALSQYFATPRFEGNLLVNGTHLRLSADGCSVAAVNYARARDGRVCWSPRLVGSRVVYYL